MEKTAITLAITEDHVLLGKALASALSSRGFQVLITAENGATLLHQLKTVVALPSLCIVDISMPVLNGYDTVKQLRHEYPLVKILAMTIFDNDTKRDAIFAAGADAYILKNEPIEKWESVIRSQCA